MTFKRQSSINKYSMENTSDITQMSTADSETSHLVGSNSNAKTNYINVANNIFGVVFSCIIIYCSFINGVSLFSFHPILMSLGWLIFMSTAINAITPGDVATDWMPIRLRSARHWVLQLAAGITILIGFIIILANKFINDKPHFVTLHAKFGLASLIFTGFTMLGGLGALYSLKLKQYMAPLFTKLIHTSVGLVTFVLGIITIILGIFSNWWSFGEILRYSSLVLILLVMLFTILRPSLKVYFRLKERIDNH